MKLCQCIGLRRLLGCLALAFLLAFASPGWAQTSSGSTASTADTYAFPYMGPDKSQAQMLEGAFTVQSYLFGAIATASATSGKSAAGLSALRVLGGFAVLIGALLFFFNSKYWRMDIIFSWLILVVIVLFAPFGSKLLFYRVPHTETNRAGFFQAAQAGTGDCSTNSKGCGLTAQVLAIDVASRLQVAISDIFRTQQWRDLVGEALSEERLKNTPLFAAEKPWLSRVDKFVGQCGSSQDLTAFLQVTKSGGNVNGSTSAAPPANESAGQIVPTTLGDQWRQLQRQYFDDKGNNNLSFTDTPPAPIVLFGDADVNNANFDKSAYVAGLQKIYDAYLPQKIIKLNGGGDSISIDTALADLKDTFLKVQGNNNKGGSGASASYMTRSIALLPGFFFVTKADAMDESSDPIKFRQCYVTQDYSKATVNTGCSQPNANNNQAKQRSITDPGLHRESLRLIQQTLNNGNGSNETIWNKFANIFKDPVIQGMPVGIGRVRFVQDNAGAIKASDKGTATGTDCVADGALLVQDGINQSFGGKFGDKFSPAVKLLLDSGVAESKLGSGDALTINDILTADGQSDLNVRKWGEALRTFFNGIIRDSKKNDSADNVVSTAKDRRMALVRKTLDMITGNTREMVMRTATDAEKNTVEDRDTVRVAGNGTLTSFGGGAAYFFGSVLTVVGAFFSGPLAQAFVAFVTVIVQLAIMVMIVVTPFLFLAGLVIPTVAMGVITTAVLGTFVLQFVPVTLIVLNYLGGFVYDVIGITAGADSIVMRSLIIIGMSGLYMTAVGMTFFLLFKLGDPAAVLGRLAQIDSGAKEMADRGMGAAVTAAGIALAATGAGLAGGAAAALKRGAMGAANAAGLGEAVDAYKRNSEQGPPEEGNPAGGDNPVNPGGGGGGSDGVAAVDNVLPEDPAAEAERLDVPQEAYNDMAFARAMGAPLPDGFDVNSSGSIVRVDHGERKQEVVATLARGSEVRDVSGGGGGGQSGAGPATDGSAAPSKITSAAVDNGNLPAASVPQGGDANNAVPATTGGAAPAAGPATPPSPNMVRQPAADNSQQAMAGPVEQRAEETPSGAARTQRTTSQSQAQGQADTILVQRELKKAEERLQGLSEAHPSYAKLKTDYENIKKIDPAAIAQGKHFEVLASLNMDEKLDNLRVGADVTPTIAQGFASGVYGSFAGLFAGAASIPIVGPALRESINEWQQAPERARAWNAAGGFKKWREAQGDAARGAFFKKEVAPLVGAHEYNEMLSTGGFQSQISNARQAASEAVAKSRSTYQTNMLHTAMYDIKDEGGAPRGYMNATELKGLGRMESQSRLSSVLTEATIMQNHSINVQKLQTSADGTLKVEEVPVKFGAMALQDMYSGFAAKGMADTFDDNLIRHYGVFEKRYFRDHKDWEASRNLSGSQDAIRSFVRKDPDADYLVGGHLKMVSGKQKYFEGKGQYENLVGLRNQNALERGDLENRLVETFNKQVAQSGLRDVAQQLVNNGQMSATELSSAGSDAAGQENLAKATKKAYLGANINKRELPLDAIFEEAYARGQMTYQSKSELARLAAATERSALKNSKRKALVDVFEEAGLSKSQLRDRQVGSERSPYKQVLEGLSSGLEESFNAIFKKQRGVSVDQASNMAEKATMDIAKVLSGMTEEQRRDIFQSVQTSRGDVANAVHADKFFDLLNKVQADASASPANSAEYIEGLRSARNEFKAVLKSSDGQTDLVMINSANDQLGEEQNWIGKEAPEGSRALSPEEMKKGRGGNRR